MDEQITSVLACPLCRGSISLNVVSRDKAGVREGAVNCMVCGTEFNIKDGVFDLRPGVTVRGEDDDHKWDLDRFEREYASVGLYKSSRDWARIRGVPVEIADFIHSYVKGQLLAWARFGAGAVVVDIGCGVGHFLLDLRARQSAPDMMFIGMDVALPRVLAMRKRCEDEGITNVLCVAGDSECLPFVADSIDHITCSEVLEHVYHPDRAISEMSRALKPTGLLLISTPSGNAARNWERLVSPIRWARNVVTGRKKQAQDQCYDVPIDLGDLRGWLIDSQFEVMDFAVRPILPSEHFFKQISPRLVPLTIVPFRFANRFLRFLEGQFGLHATIRNRKKLPEALPNGESIGKACNNGNDLGALEKQLESY